MEAVARALLLLGCAGGLHALPAQSSLPAESLAVKVPQGWRTWWVAPRAPRTWLAADTSLAPVVRWQRASDGVDHASLDLRTNALVRDLRVTLVRMDPRVVRLALHANVADRAMHPWTIGAAPATAVVASNAGQFTDAGPWGWMVHAGRELQPPATGPLSMALVVDSSGGVDLLPPSAFMGDRPAGIREALQSYPALLRGDGEVPPEVLGDVPGIDVGHRDTRLAIGILRDGRVLLALTRVLVMGRPLGPTPMGLTSAETAALMGALGARRAMMLDGGLSTQLLVRPDGGTPLAWHGLRSVPVGLAFTRQVVGTSSTIQPSRTVMMREPKRAFSSECVTCTIVVP